MYPNQGAGTGKMREIILVRSSRGTPFFHRIVILENPERVIYRIEVGGDCTYMGTLIHAGAAREGGFLQAREKK